MTVSLSLLTALLLASPLPKALLKEPENPAMTFDPGLVDINEVATEVEIRWLPTIDGHASRFSSPLEKSIRTRLETSGIHVYDQAVDAQARTVRGMLGRKLDVDPNTLRFRPGEVPVLRVAVDIVSPVQNGPVAIYAHTSFARRVCLDGRRAPSFQAAVWIAGPAVESVSSSRWQDEVQRLVLGQVESFITARRAAASHDGEARTASGECVSPESTADSPAFPFVASKSGSVFHRPDCRWAQNISEGNRIDYRTREEALQAGKRPCKTCKP